MRREEHRPHTASRRHRRLTPFGRFVRFCSLMMIAAMILLGAMRVQVLAQSTDSVQPVRMERVYSSVQIRPGDTLWSIAEEYSEEDSNAAVKSYVKELKQMNGIENDYELKPGAYIMVYYLQEEQ